MLLHNCPPTIRVVDIKSSFPGLLLTLAVIGMLGPGLFNVVIALSPIEPYIWRSGQGDVSRLEKKLILLPLIKNKVFS